MSVSENIQALNSLLQHGVLATARFPIAFADKAEQDRFIMSALADEPAYQTLRNQKMALLFVDSAATAQMATTTIINTFLTFRSGNDKERSLYLLDGEFENLTGSSKLNPLGYLSIYQGAMYRVGDKECTFDVDRMRTLIKEAYEAYRQSPQAGRLISVEPQGRIGGPDKEPGINQ